METWFSETIIKWYKRNKRDLPWRNETDPYKIWLSEVILQQTQVIQGLSYYQKFVSRYPVLNQLAMASEEEVLKLWQGLGYYSRGRNLLHTAQIIASDYNGRFPDNYLEIRKLKGIGDYTAAAIASFAFNLPHAVVDGNVYRLLSRVFGINIPIDSGAGKKAFAELAAQLLNRKHPGIHNQAIMEFGSQYCRPVNPDCPSCVFNNKCQAYREGNVSGLPVKSKKTKVKKRYFNYLVLANTKKELLVKKRTGNDIWKGLYEFPLIETKTAVAANKLFATTGFTSLAGKKFSVRYVSPTYKHVLSHQLLQAKFYVLTVNKLPNEEGTSKTSVKNLNSFAMPRLTEKFLNDCDLKEII